MSSILVTGGGGYIGSVLVPLLLEAGDLVTVVDTFRHGENSLAACANEKCFFVQNADVRDCYTMRDLCKGQDIIIPLAAIVGQKACDADQIGASSTNTAAIESMFKYLSKNQLVIFPNTNSGYGIGDKDSLCTEESPLKPMSIYGVSKMLAEQIVMRHENAISFRLATVFGASPRMRCDLLVNDFVRRAVTDRSIVVFEGHFRRNFVHVRDVAGAFIHAIENADEMRGEVYNVGDDKANLTKIELCQRIKAYFPDLTIIEAEVGSDQDKRDYLVSNEKIYETGFETSFTLDDGITELAKLFAMLRLSRYGNA